MKLIKKVAIIGIATFVMAGSTVAFGDDTPLCQKSNSNSVASGKNLPEQGQAPAPDAAKAGNTQPNAPKPAGQ